jgi:hypothetical protein
MSFLATSLKVTVVFAAATALTLAFALRLVLPD